MGNLHRLNYGRDGGEGLRPAARCGLRVVAAVAALCASGFASILILERIDARRVERRVKAQLEAAIPVGTPAWRACDVLHGINPQVEQRSNAAFGARRQLDYLYLLWNERGQSTHRMEAAVVHKDGAVTEILVRANHSAQH